MKQENADMLAITLMMKGLVAETQAELEYKEVLSAFGNIKDKYVNGSEKEKIAFIAAFTVFAAELQESM